MTPDHLKRTRQQLGLTADGLAKLVRVSSGRIVRRWEAGDNEIPGPVAVLLELIDKSAEARRLLLPRA